MIINLINFTSTVCLCRQAYLSGHATHVQHTQSDKMQFCGVLGPIQDYLSSSIHETDGDAFMKLSNYEDTVRKLDMYYGLGNYFQNVMIGI